MGRAEPLLDDLVLVVELARAGGVTAAAARLGLRKSTVSRRLAAMEARLGLRLMERGPRGLRLTEAGRGYHAQAARLVAEARALDEATRAARSAVAGTLRVAAPEHLDELLAPAVAALRAAHPALRVELAPARLPLDLVADELDLALRVGPLVPSRLVARRLGWLRTGYFASPAYLARHGRPGVPEDLAAHQRIAVAEPGSDEVWFFGDGAGARTVPADGQVRVPTLRAGLALAVAGLGVVRLPEALAAEEVRRGALSPLLEAHAAAARPVFAVFPSRPPPPKVRAFLEVATARSIPLPWSTPGPR